MQVSLITTLSSLCHPEVLPSIQVLMTSVQASLAEQTHHHPCSSVNTSSKVQPLQSPPRQVTGSPGKTMTGRSNRAVEHQEHVGGEAMATQSRAAHGLLLYPCASCRDYSFDCCPSSVQQQGKQRTQKRTQETPAGPLPRVQKKNHPWILGQEL